MRRERRGVSVTEYVHRNHFLCYLSVLFLVESCPGIRTLQGRARQGVYRVALFEYRDLVAGKGTCVGAIGEKYQGEYVNGNKHGLSHSGLTALAMRCVFCVYTLVYESLFIFHPSLAHLLRVFPSIVQSLSYE
jgi:hypothetical protein